MIVLSGWRTRSSPVSVVRSVATGTLANAVTPVSAVLTGPLLARQLDPVGRGNLAAVVTPVSFLASVGLLGVPLAATYVTARGDVSRGLILRASLPIILVTSFLSTGAFIVLAPYFLGSHPGTVNLFRVIALALPVAFVGVVMGAIGLGERRYGLTYLTSAGGAVGRAVALIALAVVGALTVRTAAFASLIPALVALPIFGPIFLRSGGPRSDSATRRALTRDLMRYGGRSSGVGLAGLINRRLDQVLLVPLVGAAQLGYYAVAVSLAELATPLIGAISTVLLPEAAARDDWALILRASRCTTALVACIGAVTAVGTPLALPVIFGHAFAPAVPMTEVLLAATVPLAARSILTAGLLSAGQPSAASLGEVVALGVTIPGLLLFVPHIGAMGAAITSLLAYILSCGVTVHRAQRASGADLRAMLVPDREDIDWFRGRIKAFAPSRSTQAI